MGDVVPSAVLADTSIGSPTDRGLTELDPLAQREGDAWTFGALRRT
jgi:hypothetical protein